MDNSKETQKEKKEAEKLNPAAKYGGAIQDPSMVPVQAPLHESEIYEDFQERVFNEQVEEDEWTDEEVGAFSHYGGSLSGHGAAYDHPETAKSVIQTLASYPEALHTYLRGSVPNPEVKIPHLTSNAYEKSGRGSRASIVDYGGSLGGLTHSVNGYLTRHDDEFPHEFHISGIVQ